MKLDLIQFTSNAAIMMSMMLIPNIAVSVGADLTQVGAIGCVYGLCLFVSSYLFSKAADAWNIKILMVFGLACSTIAYFLQVFASDPLSLGLARGFLGICIGMYPAAMIMHVHGMKRSIGKFISFGSLGWAAGFLGAGVIGVVSDYRMIFAASALLMVVSFVVALTLPDVSVPRIPVRYLSLDTVRANWAIYLSFMLRHTGATAVWVIFPLYMVNLGANELWIGIVYAINPLLQFFTMRRLDNRDMVKIVRYGYLISAIAFLSFIPPTMFYYTVPGMILVALSWSFLYVGSTELLLRTNKDKAAAAGLITSVVSLSSVIGSLLGGVVSHNFGFTSVFLVGSSLSFIGFLISVRYFR
jgi:predicted MFS family arabinose efflux permease